MELFISLVSYRNGVILAQDNLAGWNLSGGVAASTQTTGAGTTEARQTELFKWDKGFW